MTQNKGQDVGREVVKLSFMTKKIYTINFGVIERSGVIRLKMYQ